MSQVSHTYRLSHTMSSRFYLGFAPFLLGAPVVAALVVHLLLDAPQKLSFFASIPIPALLTWLAVVAFCSYEALRTPTVIEWHSDGTVVFRSPIRRVRMPAAGIRSIQPAGTLGFLVVRGPTGKVRFLNQFEGFHAFIALVRQANPDVILRGC
jgi:hypothetical protein